MMIYIVVVLKNGEIYMTNYSRTLYNIMFTYNSYISSYNRDDVHLYKIDLANLKVEELV